MPKQSVFGKQINQLNKQKSLQHLKIMNKKPTVTIGIPAYNEEANIGYLLKSILNQKQTNFVIQKILVLCDGCTDKTIEIVQKLAKQNKTIKIIKGRTRKGKSARLNQLYSLNKSDIVVNFDADIKLKGKYVIRNMVKRLENKVLVVGANFQPMKGRTFGEKIAVAWENMWYEIRYNYKNGNNIYNSAGCGFAIKKTLTDIFRYPQKTVADQQFIYFAAKKNGGEFAFAKDAIIFYQVPSSLQDYFQQASRWLKERYDIAKFVNTDNQSEYEIPKKQKIIGTITSLRKDPIYTFFAIFFQIALRVLPKKAIHNKGIWETIDSTKDLNHINKEKHDSRDQKYHQFKRFLARFIYFLGKIFRVNGNAANVLCYHSISKNKYRHATDAEIFKKQIKKIAQNTKFVSLDEILSLLNKKNVKCNTIAITFDDGYKDILKISQFLEKNKIIPTLFITSNPENINRNEINNNLNLLKWKDIESLINKGWDIGCHSATHEDLVGLNDKELEMQIVESKKVLEKKLGVKIKYFAYPKGHYTKKIIEKIKKAGFKAAFSINAGSVNQSNNKWILPRTAIDKTHKLSEFPIVYSDTTHLIRKLVDRLNLWNKIFTYE